MPLLVFLLVAHVLYVFFVLLLFTCCGCGACCQGDGEGKAEGGQKKKGHEKKLKNQFNFSERASQTYNYPLRVSASLCVCFYHDCTYIHTYILCIYIRS